MAPQPSLLVGELGPTNTGKTHRAIERMLEHDSGMMGLPLRLLAREVYDRVTAKVGEARVALITGEEKRVPAHPAYWICTVEAMPVATRVDFLAVDEIQLAAHRERGHVFTQRLLHARGEKETWFLGADTMRPLMRELLPGAVFRRSERLSQLRSFGTRSLKSLPPRSAVVAFSTERVYELAESLRHLRGGVAVVLGALSPRTRNAQVAMFQAGEVQYLVATDAIGMGLNLELERVAFAALSKFDGFEQRELTVDELAQIAGRAGRHLKDGSFGTLSTAPALEPRVIQAIEEHRFSPVRQLVWRNVELDFDSPRALLDSLSVAPSHEVFNRVERADDFDALKSLAHDEEVLRFATAGDGVERLWEVCRIPDFRKGLLGEHSRLVKEVFLQLSAGSGRLSADWLSAHVERLDDVRGDIHVLTARLEAIRTWAYISHRSHWLDGAGHWQQRTRHIEDALGDALHQRLVERFVQRAALARRAKSGVPAPAPSGPFAQLQALVEQGPTPDGRVQRVVDGRNDAFALEPSGLILFEREKLGRLTRGLSRRTPQVALLDANAWTAGQRSRLERRLAAYARDLVSEASGGFPLETLTTEGRPAPLRAVAWSFAEGLGIARRDAGLLEQVRLLDADSKQRLDALGVLEGARYLAIAGALTPRALELRATLTALFTGEPRPAGVPLEPLAPRESLTGRDAEAWGYAWLGPFALRIDALERLNAALVDPRGTAVVFESLGVPASVRPGILRELTRRR